MPEAVVRKVIKAKIVKDEFGQNPIWRLDLECGHWIAKPIGRKTDSLSRSALAKIKKPKRSRCVFCNVGVQPVPVGTTDAELRELAAEHLHQEMLSVLSANKKEQS